jgi:hypothetical protein
LIDVSDELTTFIVRVEKLDTSVRMIKRRRMRWVGLVTGIREIRNAYKILVGKPERKRPLEGSWSRQKDNIKLNLVWGCGLASSGSRQ